MRRILPPLSFTFFVTLSSLIPAFSAVAQSQPEKLSKHQLQSLIATARTPAEHERIAHYYEAKAQFDLAEADQQQQLAEQFRANPVTDSAKFVIGNVNHSEYEAQKFRQDAAKYQALAREQEQMAERAPGQ